jgi:hypothetical protein
MGWPAPLLVFFYTLLVKRCILDGWAGWVYALQRTVAEALISLEIADRRLRGSPTENSTLSSPAAIPPAQSMTSKTFH